MSNRAHDFFDIDLTIEVHDLRQLNRILEAMRNKPLVSTAYRVTGSEG
jgi:(p)ppGpp synthase/HD superfamily hydrolase